MTLTGTDHQWTDRGTNLKNHKSLMKIINFELDDVLLFLVTYGQNELELFLGSFVSDRVFIRDNTDRRHWDQSEPQNWFQSIYCPFSGTQSVPVLSGVCDESVLLPGWCHLPSPTQVSRWNRFLQREGKNNTKLMLNWLNANGINVFGRGGGRGSPTPQLSWEFWEVKSCGFTKASLCLKTSDSSYWSQL